MICCSCAGVTGAVWWLALAARSILHAAIEHLHAYAKLVTHKLKHNGTTFTVVEVEPSFPS